MPDPVLGTGVGGQECSGTATRITALSISVSTGQNLTVHVHSEGGKGELRIWKHEYFSRT